MKVEMEERVFYEGAPPRTLALRRKIRGVSLFLVCLRQVRITAERRQGCWRKHTQVLHTPGGNVGTSRPQTAVLYLRQTTCLPCSRSHGSHIVPCRGNATVECATSPINDIRLNITSYAFISASREVFRSHHIRHEETVAELDPHVRHTSPSLVHVATAMQVRHDDRRLEG